jgi:hypothetical protein
VAGLRKSETNTLKKLVQRVIWTERPGLQCPDEESLLPTIERMMGLKPGELFHRLWLKLMSEDVGRSRFLLRRLENRNVSAREAVVSPGGPVVSMTTYGKRVDTVYLTLESIALGSRLPSRLILWLDELDRYHNLPESLRRLQARGLEIRLTPNYGPHKKYYPYLQSGAVLDAPLATADDDVIYPSSWLKGLSDSYNAYPSLVSCYRAHVVRFEGQQFAPYVTWKRCRSTTPSFLNFATGVSGTIYPPALQEQIKAAGLGFEPLCPRADDVWLHLQALRGGFRVKQLKSWEQSFPELPGTQDMGLVVENVHGSQNDLQIQKTYTAADIALLRAES